MKYTCIHATVVTTVTAAAGGISAFLYILNKHPHNRQELRVERRPYFSLQHLY